MTAADVLHLPAGVLLPSLASHRDVVVEWVPALELDQCVSCPDDLASPPPVGIYEIRYTQWAMNNLTMAVCSAECAQRELTWLLRERPDSRDNARDIRLLAPEKLRPKPLPVPDSDSDAEFQLYHSLLKLVETMPNSAPEAQKDGFEMCRNKIRAHLAQLGLNRIEQLGRVA